MAILQGEMNDITHPKSLSGKKMMNRMIIYLFCSPVFWGCDNTNLDLAAQAGIDVIKTTTLRDKEVELLACGKCLETVQFKK